MNYSDEQKRALESKNKDLIVSAQAGAGKTQVLVKRVIQQVSLEGYSLENMLIVTFTNKAAGELKSRIRMGLFKALENTKPGEKKLRTHLLKEITAVASANIQTLHAFCYQLIRENYDRLAMDPGVHILDGKKLDQLKEDSLDEILREVYEEKDPKTLSFIEAYGLYSRTNDDPIRQLIINFFEEKAKKINGDQWIQFWLNEIAKDSYDQKIEALFHKKYQKKLEDLVLIMEEMAEKAQDMPEKYQKALIEEATSAKASLSAWEKGEKKEISFVKRMPSINKKRDGAWAVEIKNRLNRQRNENKKIAKDLFDSEIPDLSMIHEEKLKMFESLTILSSLASRFEKAFQEKKKELEGIDFNDVERLALLLLKEDDIREKVRKKFTLIYFDEYQDASDIQNEIIEQMKNPRGLFFVGDVKQSIYAFRQACPENFQKRFKDYADKNRESAEALSFTVNYRSLPGILKFVNFLFIPLMTKDRGNIVYDSPIHRARVQPYSEELRLSMEKGESFPGKVHVAILDSKLDEEDRMALQKGNSYLNEKSAEAFYIARKIKEHVRAGGSYRDCAILLRKDKGNIFEFESVLKAFNIPVHSDGDPIDMQATELSVALSLLEIIDNDRADIPLLTVLSSVVGGFTDEDLASIRFFYPEGPFYEAYQKFLSEDSDEISLFASFTEEEREENKKRYQNIKEKIQSFDEKLRSWRDLFSQMPLSRAIWKVFQASGLYAFSSSLDFGRERRENLNLLLRLAEAYEKEGFSDLYGYLSLAKANQSSEGESIKPAESLSASDDVVRIMTMHAAKGLDFKVVFLAGLGGELTGGRDSDFAYDDELGPALKIKWIDPESQRLIQGPSIIRSLIKERERKKDLDEEVRVLYVAMTRASQELYLSGQKNLSKRDLSLPSLEDPSKALQRNLDQSKSYLEWILSVLRYDQVFWLQAKGSIAEQLSFSSDQLPQRNFYQLKDGNSSRLIDIEIEKSSKYRPWDGSLSEERAEELPLKKEDQRQREEIHQISNEEVEEVINFTYPHIEDTLRPLKETVSELVKKERLWDDPQSVKIEAKELNQKKILSFPDEALSIPSFMDKEHLKDPAEFGILMHRALQSLPFKEYSLESLDKSLDKLVERELFTEEEKKSLDLSMLLKFYHSDQALWLGKHSDAVFREKSFTMRLDGPEGRITLDGQIDLFVDFRKATRGQEKGILLVDYKTDRRPRAELYRGQLKLYAQALEKALKQKVVKVYLYWVRPGKWEEIKL